MPSRLASHNAHSRAWPSAIRCWLVILGILAPAAGANPLISNVNSDKAMYSPSAGVTIYVDFQNTTGTNFSGSVAATITHLGPTITNLASQSLSLAPAGTTTKTFSWTPPAVDCQGYLVLVSVKNSSGTAVDAASSAIDVSSDWAKFPRYGYVAQYGSGLDAWNIVWQLKNYHLNGLQFYDWQWKHHIPYKAASTWPDVANRTVYRSTVSNLISAAHSYNLVAMNYNLYGAAYDNYASDGSGVTLSMGIFSGPTPSSANQLNHPLPGGWATAALYEMNNRDSGWQSYIFGREQTTFANFGFDGWHVDALGQHTVYDYAGTSFNLDDYNPQFINNAKAALGRRMTFNTVDAVGENQIAQSANVDFVYSELWAGNANYIDFKSRVDNVRRFGSKAVVFPAYMNYAKTSGTFNEPSVRLADAAIFANGGSHLELGDGDKMLHKEYFPDDQNVLMTSALAAALRNYYDFLVGYENILRDGAVSAANTVTVTGAPAGTDGSAGAVWVITRKTLGFNTLHLINLVNNPSTAWRDDNGTYPAPPVFSNLGVKMYYSGTLGGGKLWYATPDTNSSSPAQLNYTAGADGGGNYVNFTVPQLQYWDMFWLEINGTNSAASQTQAENYDSMAGIGTEATSDTGGGLDVGFVANTTGDSYVAFNNIDFGAGPSSVSARVASAAATGTIEFRLDSPAGALIATVPVGNTGGWQSWQTVTASVSGASGIHKLFVVFKNAASNLNWFNFNFPLPSPWQTADIGSVGQTGSATYTAGTFTVAGSGADIEGSGDAFRYVYQPATGDCEVRARVLNVQNTDPWAKAGVMIRESAAPGAANAAVVVTPGNGVAFQRRTAAGGGTASTVVSGVSAPKWVRLVRTVTNAFRAYYSADATNWTQVGTAATISMSNSVSAGLAVTAHNNSAICTATFDSVSLNQSPVLAAVSNATLLAGQTLVITNAASDADVPAQSLAYRLLSAPAGASINTNSGVFTWRPTIAQSPSTQTVTVAVSDSGIPVMSVTQSFAVTVAAPAYPALSSAVATNAQFAFWITGDKGPDYIIQASTDLIIWSSVDLLSSPDLPCYWADTNAALFSPRFYRGLLGP
jgi:dextranase